MARCFRHVIGEPLVQLGPSSSTYGFINRLDLAAAVIALLMVLELLAGVCQQPVSLFLHFMLTCCTAFCMMKRGAVQVSAPRRCGFLSYTSITDLSSNT